MKTNWTYFVACDTYRIDICDNIFIMTAQFLFIRVIVVNFLAILIPLRHAKKLNKICYIQDFEKWCCITLKQRTCQSCKIEPNNINISLEEYCLWFLLLWINWAPVFWLQLDESLQANWKDLQVKNFFSRAIWRICVKSPCCGVFTLRLRNYNDPIYICYI